MLAWKDERRDNLLPLCLPLFHLCLSIFLPLHSINISTNYIPYTEVTVVNKIDMISLLI